MIITKQLDIQGSDKTSTVQAATPRTNLVKELEKYSRHSESVEKRTAGMIQAPFDGQEKADAIAASLASGPLLLQKVKVNKPVAKERPNILSKRPRFRPQQRSSSTDSSSSTSSLSSQALNLSTRSEGSPDIEANFMKPEEAPISAAAALTIPSPSVIMSTSIPTPPTISVTQKGVPQLMVPVTTNGVFPASPDDIVVPAGNGYVVYKPVNNKTSKSASNITSVNTTPAGMVSLLAAPGAVSATVTASTLSVGTSLSPSIYKANFTTNMPPPPVPPLTSKVTIVTASSPIILPPPTSVPALTAIPVPVSTLTSSSAVSLLPRNSGSESKPIIPTPSPNSVATPPTIPTLNQNPVLPSPLQQVAHMEAARKLHQGLIRASLRHKIDKNNQKDKSGDSDVLSNLLAKSLNELKQGGMLIPIALTNTEAPVTNVVSDTSKTLDVKFELSATSASSKTTPVSMTVALTSNKTSASSATTGPSVINVSRNINATHSGNKDNQKIVYYRKLVIPTNSLPPTSSQNNRISTVVPQTTAIPQAIAIPKNPMLVGIDCKQERT